MPKDKKIHRERFMVKIFFISSALDRAMGMPFFLKLLKNHAIIIYNNINMLSFNIFIKKNR